MLTLGIDTSNYATSLAVFDTQAQEVVCAVKRFLPVKPSERGLRQSDAVFHHTAALPEMLNEVAGQADFSRIGAVGVSERPRPVEGSYMPCFLTGLSAATAFAYGAVSYTHLDVYKRQMQDFGLNQDDASLLASNKARSEFFDSCVAMHKCDAKLVSNWVIGDIARILNERRIEIGDTALTKENLTDMICLIEKGTISNTAAKTVLETIIEEDVSPAKVVEEKGLAQVNDADALQKIVNDVLAANQKAVADYKGCLLYTSSCV